MHKIKMHYTAAKADGDVAATESLLRRSCAVRAPSGSSCASRLSDTARRMMRPAFIFLRVDLNFKDRAGPQS